MGCRNARFPRWVLLSVLAVAACAEAGKDAGDDDDDDVAQIDGGGGGECGSATCTASQDCCDGICVDTQNNATHCGTCGNACDSEKSSGCTAGSCTCNFASACTGDSTCCATGCKNTMTDAQNCGLCGRPCGPGETCMGGQCVCGTTGSECQGGLDCCPAGCVDTSMDEANCGTCGMTCTGGDLCTGGACACAFTCPPPLPLFSKVVCCGDGCYDICTDPAHCGGCPATTCDTCDLGGCTYMGMEVTPPDLLNCFFPSP
jgi:hypothetical protein